MKHKTHKRIIKILFPNLDERMIEVVSKSLDTPKPWMPPFHPALGRFPGLSYRGHRMYGHDLRTAILLAMFKGGIFGVPVALTHLAKDALRDQVVKQVGEDGADIFEDLFNFVYGRQLGRKGRKRRKKSKDRTQ